MKGAILQPMYLPWLGYFEMIDSVEVFILFDHVQLERKSWQHRNRIKTSNGIVTLSLPIKRKSQDLKIYEAKISYDHGNPLAKHWTTIQLAYKKAPFYDNYCKDFSEIFSSSTVSLRDFNVTMTKLLCRLLGLDRRILCSSELELDDDEMGKTEKVINLCKKTNITNLYDGKSAANFLDISLFKKEGISINFQQYKHPVYNQLWGDFAPYLSVLDLLFNEGKSSLEIIRSGRCAQ